MGCGASNATSTSSASSSASLYCKTCGSRQVDVTISGCPVCGAFNRLHTPLTPTSPDLNRTGSIALSELQRTTESETIQQQKVVTDNKQPNERHGGEMNDNVGTLVSCSIENAIKRMNAVDNEIVSDSTPGNADVDQSNRHIAPNSEDSQKCNNNEIP